MPKLHLGLIRMLLGVVWTAEIFDKTPWWSASVKMLPLRSPSSKHCLSVNHYLRFRCVVWQNRWKGDVLWKPSCSGSTLVVGTVLTSIWCISVVWHVYLPYPSCAGQVRCFIDFPVHQFPLFFSSSQHFWEHLIPIPFLQRRQHPWHNKDTTRCLNHAWTLVVDQDAASSLPKTCHILPPRCSHPQSSLPSVCPPKHPLPESGHSTAKPSEAPAGCSPHVPNVSDGHSSLQNNLPLR